MRTLWLLVGFIVLLFVAWGIKNLRHENVYLESRVAKVESDVNHSRDQNRELQTRVLAERQRLDSLRESLETVNQAGLQPPTDCRVLVYFATIAIVVRNK